MSGVKFVIGFRHAPLDYTSRLIGIEIFFKYSIQCTILISWIRLTLLIFNLICLHRFRDLCIKSTNLVARNLNECQIKIMFQAKKTFFPIFVYFPYFLYRDYLAFNSDSLFL